MPLYLHQEIESGMFRYLSFSEFDNTDPLFLHVNVQATPFDSVVTIFIYRAIELIIINWCQILTVADRTIVILAQFLFVISLCVIDLTFTVMLYLTFTSIRLKVMGLIK